MARQWLRVFEVYPQGWGPALEGLFIARTLATAQSVLLSNGDSVVNTLHKIIKNNLLLENAKSVHLPPGSTGRERSITFPNVQPNEGQSIH